MIFLICQNCKSTDKVNHLTIHPLFVQLDQPSLILPGRDYYNESVYATALPALRTYIQGLAEALGAQGVEQAVMELVSFEQEVAQVCASKFILISF